MITGIASRLAILCWAMASTAIAGAAYGAEASTESAKNLVVAQAAPDAAAKDKAAKEEAARKATEKAAAAPIEQIIITGSHIHQDEYSSASPIQVIRKDESVLAGLTTTTDTLQGSTVSGGSNQINNYFGGYVTDGGPGANTLSLRGLGAVRTLVLLNGRRLAPAGTRGSVGSADLNVLPSAMVDRIEILKDGASSIYGSDAVAGVVNIITRKGIRDWTVEGTRVQTRDGGGDQTSFSVVGGHSWDKFEVSGSLEYYDRTNLAVGQRDWASCPTSEFIDPTTGKYVGSIIDPITQRPKCFPVGGEFGTNGIANNYIAAALFDPDTFDFLGTRWTPDSASAGPVPGWRNVNPLGKRSGFFPAMLNESLISPTRNYTMFLNGSYDLGALGGAEAYFEALYDRRESHQIGARQLSLDYQYDASNGFAGHPFVPQVLTDRFAFLGPTNPFGDDIEARAFVGWGNDDTRETVDFSRFVAGLRGDLTFLRGWKYDANVTVSRAKGSYTFQSWLTDRIYNSLYVVPVSGPTNAPTRNVGGIDYTCASNIGSANPICVPAPFLDAAFLSGTVDNAYRNYVWQDVTGNTTYNESTFQANVDGGLFNVPAGEVRAALGVEIRTLKLDDTPAADSINGNLYNLTTAGITRGKDAVREIYAEIEAPILRGKPFAESLTLNLSGRYTDYNSYGSDRTYKLGLNYAPLKWIKLRATKGSSFRAPALFEQYLSPTSGFFPGTIDPCNDYGQGVPTSPIYQNCASEGLPPDFTNNNGIQVNSAGGAALGLKSENSHADTLGVVFQPTLPARLGDVALAVDWWRINIANQVNQIGAFNLLSLCYNDPQFRAGGSYCAYSTRDNAGLLVVQDNYINISTQLAEGVDYNVRYTKSVGVGELIVDLRATRYLRQDNRVLPVDPLDKYNGTLDFPKWVGDADVRYKWKDYTFRYGLTYVAGMDSNAYLGLDPAVDPYNFRTPAYLTHDVSMKYQSLDKWSLILGIRNLTNERPPQISAGAYNRAGNSLLYSGFDYFGPRLFLTVSKTL